MNAYFMELEKLFYTEGNNKLEKRLTKCITLKEAKLINK